MARTPVLLPLIDTFLFCEGSPPRPSARRDPNALITKAGNSDPDVASQRSHSDCSSPCDPPRSRELLPCSGELLGQGPHPWESSLTPASMTLTTQQVYDFFLGSRRSPVAPASPGKSHWAPETKRPNGQCQAISQHRTAVAAGPQWPERGQNCHLPQFWSHLQLRTDRRKRCSHAHSHPRSLPGTAGLSLPRPGLYHTQEG